MPLNPNLVQTIEGNPAIIHGGPFANIAQGTNTVIATKMGMSLSEYTVTEAGFGFDLGGEKFLDIKCQSANLKPKVCGIDYHHSSTEVSWRSRVISTQGAKCSTVKKMGFQIWKNILKMLRNLASLRLLRSINSIQIQKKKLKLF